MSKSLENLKAAFAGESQANRKYTNFADKADVEGHHQVAKLFRAAAAAEAIHARSHLKTMEGIGSTEDNLKAAIAGEHYEVNSMYPAFLKEAEEENNAGAKRTFHDALEVEKTHEALYNKALETLGKSAEAVDYYICPICGFTHEGPLSGRCPVCNAPGEKFFKVD